MKFDPKQSVSRLRDLYQQSSKHSNYQVLARSLRPYIDHDSITVRSRFERERLTYILEHINPRDARMLDIGGNAGFFTFEMLLAGAASVTYCEGNATHCMFVEEASRILGIEHQVVIQRGYYEFGRNRSADVYDVCLLLNVLHHLGDDFGDRTLTLDSAKEEMRTALRNLSREAKVMVLQLGFCWKGDRTRPLFPHGTKREMIAFVSDAVRDEWRIEHIGIAATVAGALRYEPLSSTNDHREDRLGEFLNRPLFILRSNHLGASL